MNPFEEYLKKHTAGPGAWKWTHYLDVYHRHFSRFRGKEVHIAEVGIYSGGSLGMWRDYFGDQCHVYGIDIQEACRKFENDWCKVFIGDQGSRDFWKQFKAQVPHLDILIDDGGHLPEQQLVTLEEILPALAPGGVFCCEDLLLDTNKAFSSYLGRMADDLHPNVDIHAQDMLAMGLTPFQRMVESIHIYPHIAVIERRLDQPIRFEAPGYGDQWIHTTPEWRP